MYWGANVGYSWGQSKNDRTLFGLGVTATESQDLNGVIGGVQTGYNYQFGAWVWGLETDIQASGQKGSAVIPLIPGATLTTDHKLQWFGTTRPRLGFLATPNLLLYGTAGVAYGQVKDTFTAAFAGAPGAVATVNDLRAGWTAGAGIEGALGGLEREGRIPLCRPRQAREDRHGARRRPHRELQRSADRQHRARRPQLQMGRGRLRLLIAVETGLDRRVACRRKRPFVIFADRPSVNTSSILALFCRNCSID